MFGRKKKNREMVAEMPQMTERPRVVRTVPELATFPIRIRDGVSTSRMRYT